MSCLKKILIGIALIFFVGGVIFSSKTLHEQHEQKVMEKITTYVEKKYGKENIISVKSAYDGKHRDSEKRYQIAVKVDNQGLNEGEYLVFRLEDSKVIPWGSTYTLPKENEK